MMSRFDAWRRGPAFLFLAAGLLMLPSSQARAGWQPNGVPIAPPGPGGFQRLPHVCSDGVGGAFISWSHYTSQDDGDTYLVRLDAEGNRSPGWPPTGLVLSAQPTEQFVSNLVPDGQGGVYVIWSSYEDQGIQNFRLQHVLPSGALAPGWPGSGLTLPMNTGAQKADGFCDDGQGGVYVVWTSRERRVLMLRYTGDGQVAPGWNAIGRPLVDFVSTQFDARIIPVADGGLLASWDDSRDGPGVGMTRYALRITPSGDPAPGWPAAGRRLHTTATVTEYSFMISDGAGGAFVGWNDARNGVPPINPLSYDLYAQHVLADGTIDSRWPAAGLPVAVAPSAQYYFKMVEDGSGGAIFVWDDYRAGAQIYAVRIRADGSVAPGWTPHGAPMAPYPTAQTTGQPIADGAGGVYGLWSQGSPSIVLGQHLDTQGTPAPGWTTSGRVVAAGPGVGYFDPVATGDGQGGAIVAYEQRTFTSSLIYAQRVLADGPVPTRIAFLDTEVEPGVVRLRWSASDAPLARATVYRRQGDAPWTAIGAPVSVGSAVLAFEDRDVGPGRYAYRLGVIEGTSESFTEENWVEVPSAFTLSLAGFRPNPAVGPLSLAFSLPDDRPARLDVIDVRGRIVHSRDVGGLGAGRHVVSLAGETPLRAGVYWIRLNHPERTLTVKGLVLR